MPIPTLFGVIKRRFLISYRAHPKVIKRILPAPFEPKLHRGYAIVGICLIRLESIRPRGLPAFIGVSSENAAHRVAVQWVDAAGRLQDGVFIPRRDTNSWVNALVGGNLFPGEHHRARFAVEESAEGIAFTYRSLDSSVEVRFSGSESPSLPDSSCFETLEEASTFFRTGSLGYSTTQDPKALDGIVLDAKEWRVRPFQVHHVFSSFFEDTERFPSGTIEFDHALIMRNSVHAWHSAPTLIGATPIQANADGGSSNI
jgi:hypothetical protein